MRVLLAACLAVLATAHGARAATPLDIVLALDNSGSMKENDPNGVMRTAVFDFASRLPADARMGIVVFDKGATLALSLTPVGDGGFRERLTGALRALDYRGPMTDIPGGIERSVYEVREHGRPGSRRVVLLFTDGHVDLGDPTRDRSRTDWLVSDLVPEAVRQKAVVFGLAFTDQADFELIQSLSLKTGGSYFRLRDSAQIPNIFSQVIERLDSADAPRLVPQPAAAAGAPSPEPTFVGHAPTWVGLLLVLAIAIFGWRRWVQADGLETPATLHGSGDPGRTHEIQSRIYRVGRVSRIGMRRNDLVLKSENVSRAHATIRFTSGGFEVTDDGSMYGTFVNGNRLTAHAPCRLKNDDVVRFDTKEFSFGYVDATAMDPGVKTVWSPPDRSAPAGAAAPASQRPASKPSGQNPVFSPTVLEPRIATKPPEDLLATRPPQRHARPVSDEAVCLHCDKRVRPDELAGWEGLAVCRSCRSLLLTLPTAEAKARRLELSVKSQRLQQTNLGGV